MLSLALLQTVTGKSLALPTLSETYPDDARVIPMIGDTPKSLDTGSVQGNSETGKHMAKKTGNKQAHAPQDPNLDGLPTHGELDALQAQIDQAARDAVKRKPEDNGEDTSEAGPPDSDNAKIEALETELATLRDQALRAMAETENVKKRAEREVKAAGIYAVERFAADMLSVYDNLGRALGIIDDEARKTLGENAQNLLDGLELTEKDLIAVFARHGIRPVAGKGAKFDPNVHQAVAQIPSDKAKGEVAEMMQTGFTLGERTLRAAMVAVSTGSQKS